MSFTNHAFYAGEKIDIQTFNPNTYSSQSHLKTMLANPLAIVEYFHNMITIIIEKLLKGGTFSDLAHHYGTIEYQGRHTPHIYGGAPRTVQCARSNASPWSSAESLTKSGQSRPQGQRKGRIGHQRC